MGALYEKKSQNILPCGIQWLILTITINYMRTYRLTDTYYTTQAAALNAIQDEFENNRPHDIVIVYPENLWCEHVAYGQTVHYNFPLRVKRTGNPAKKWLHISLYRMDSGNYECLYYVA
jgi:hypothetical protein